MIEIIATANFRCISFIWSLVKIIKPPALVYFTDKHGVFRINYASNEDRNKLTQDRLVKEMRLAGVNGIEEANE